MYYLTGRPAVILFCIPGQNFAAGLRNIVNADTAASLKKRISAYQNRVVEMRYILGDAPQKDIGIYNLFFMGMNVWTTQPMGVLCFGHVVFP